jgi:two-component system nitrogen regulation response regulator GlnG
LRNALEHAAIIARGGPLLPEHLPPMGAAVSAQTPAEQVASAVRLWLADRIREAGGQAPTNLYQDLLGIVEPALLADVMQRLRNNRWVAAQWLGLNRATVRKKLGAYGLTDAKSAEEDEEAE